MNTIINGYEIDLECEGQCFISHSSYSSSLEALMATGVLEGNQGGYEVPTATIDKIEAWANKNGYAGD